jgi:hypothetical protein
MESGGVVALTEQYQDLTWCLETILSTMRAFAGCSPLIGVFLLARDMSFSAHYTRFQNTPVPMSKRLMVRLSASVDLD